MEQGNALQSVTFLSGEKLQQPPLCPELSELDPSLSDSS